MASRDEPTPERGRVARLLFPGAPRYFPWARPLQLLLRSLHITAMALVLGGLPFGADAEALRLPLWLTVLSGAAMFVLDLVKDAAILTQGSGVAVLVKLGLLGLGLQQPAHRLSWYLAATVVASLGSHMPGAWRHFSLVQGRVVRYPD